MSQVKDLLVDEMRDLLHAEGQLLNALPKMEKAARHPKLKEAFAKHLVQTREHLERLNMAFELLGEEPKPKTCHAMLGLVQEGEETIQEASDKDQFAADLALITAAQKTEHYEIAGYGTVRFLARQIGEVEVANLLSQTLGEEEATDHMLTSIAKPILQQAAYQDMQEMAPATH